MLLMCWGMQWRRMGSDMKWIGINDQLPTVELMLERDILIYRENGTYGVGVFHYDEHFNIYSMTYNSTTKHMDFWKFQPTHWAIVEPPQDK